MKQVRNYFFIAVIALALAGCGGAQINNHLAGAAVLGQSTQPAPPPQVSAEFQAEIAQISASGLRLKEALEASLEAGMRHLVAVFKRDNPKEPSQAFEFRIIESDGKAAKTIFRRAEFFFSLSATGNLGKSNATDLNGDGLKEVFVQSSSGGNCWSCNPTEVYRVRSHKGELIAAGPIQKIDDLNGDGLQELLVTDTRWESYDDLSHAASPTAVMVYTWRNGQYVYAARDFPSFYQSETARLRAAIEEAKAQITAEEFSDELYIGNSIALAITYAHMGEPERGVKELEALLNANSRSEVQSKHRATMLEDFRKGESAKKIREMKYGDAMPIG